MSGLGDILGKITDPGDFLGVRSGREATAAQVGTAREALSETERQFDIGQERLEPFFQEAVPAFQRQAALSGARGSEEQAQAFQQFQESPGTQFLREQGLRLIDTGAAATGGLGGGQRLRELTKFSQGLAEQDLSNQFNRLGIVSGRGQTAATQQAGLGQQFSQDVGSILGQQASIIGAGQQAQAQTTSNLIGSAAGLAASFFSDSRLKKNIEKVGNLASGLAWYLWEWTDEASDLVGDQPAHGVMAQEVQIIFPEAVALKDGFLAVNYSRIY